MKNILERYQQQPDGRYIIDITAGKVSDLYNHFDKHTPYARKELDQELVEYIYDSARDLGEHGYIIMIHLLEPPEDDLKSRITDSINGYFLYLKSIELNELSRIIRASLIYLMVGILLLFLTVWVNGKLTADSSVINQVFATGLTVAAWVSLWEALATFLVNWAPYNRKIKRYKRLSRTPIQFSE